MRVLEKEIVSPFNMGKKNKHKIRKSKENDVSDSSEEVSSKGCPHISKSVNFNAMKKGLSKLTYGECSGCAKDLCKRESKSLIDQLEGATSSDFSDDIEPTIWVCLQCGHQGCGRQSQEKHALKHFEAPRSTQHSVVINTTTWSAWCYDCDDELQPEKYKKIAECLEHIKKVAGLSVVDAAQGRNSNGGLSSNADSSINKSRSGSGRTGTAGCNKVKGLSNLGNTCFFNAVMQNLVQTYSLENLLGERKKGHPLKLQGHQYFDPDDCSSSDEGENEKNQKNIAKDLASIEVSISDPGPLTQALVLFLHDINNPTRSGCINPSALFGQVCKKAPRFKGMQQQDSHELLRYLMDNMKTEEIKRGQSGILKYFKLSENTNPKKVDEETKYRVKAYGQEVKHTFVECLFGGQLISTVVCEECKFISQILEPFLDLSLPVTEEKPQRPNQLHQGRKKEIESESKEIKGLEGFLPPKDDKPSKHQSKKQKRRQKRDARRHGKGKSGSVGDKDDDDADEKEEENEEKDGPDGEKNEQGEKWDDSDADVEDNLESDTSRCYKSLSDSMMPSLESPDKSVAGGSNNASPEKVNMATENGMSKSVNSDDGVKTFQVYTNIENHGKNGNPNLPIPSDNNVNGDVKVENGDQELSVTYTFTNGRLSENPNNVEYTVENCVNTRFTVTCDTNHDVPKTTLCNGDVGNHNEVDSAEEVKSEKVTVDLNTDKTTDANTIVRSNVTETNNLVNGDSVESAKLHDDIRDSEKADEVFEDVPNGNGTLDVQMDTSLTDLTSEISTLSIGDSTSIASDLSRLTLKDEEVKENEHKDNEHKGNEHKGIEQGENEHKDRSGTNSRPNSGHFVSGIPNGDIGDSSHVQCKHPAMSQASVHIGKQNRFKDLQREGKKKSVNTLAERYHPSAGECSIQSCLNQFTAAELLTGNNKFGCKNCTKLKYKNNPHKEKKETVYSNANKQYLIFQPPAVLTLHLKRFEQVGFSSRKVNRHVDFPFVLDIAPYCSSLSQGIKHNQKKILYSLYGVVEHSGRLTSGHYTAYVKVRPNIGTLNNFLNKHNVTLKEYLHTYAQTVMNGDRLDTENVDGVNTDGLSPPGRWYHISDSSVSEVAEAFVERAQAYLLFYERIY